MADFSVMPKMLPALPQAFGNLKDVFRSANCSLHGESNPLGLTKVKNSLVILVDGLGWFNLSEHLGHVQFLKKHMHKSFKGYAGFPSTTAASLMSFATGVSPSQHGFIGYRVFDRSKSESINLLTGLAAENVNDYIRTARIADTQSQTVVISKPEYAGSGFSIATFNNAEFKSSVSVEERFELALTEMNTGAGKLIYLYVPELDQAAHRFGYKSRKWVELLELVDAETKKLVSQLLPGRGVLLTADHGIVDVDHSFHVYLDEFDGLAELLDVGGDPRATFLYFAANTNIGLQQQKLNTWLDGRGYAHSPQELVASGLYESSVLNFSELLPDLVVLAATNRVCYHRAFAKPASLAMIGQHGGVSDQEIAVPILRLANYSSSLLVP